MILHKKAFLAMVTQKTDIYTLATWIKYSRKLCNDCVASCCSMAVEVRTSDLVRMGVMDEFEAEEGLKKIARRLKKEGVVEHFHYKKELFTLTRMANGDCLYLDNTTRRCTIYQERPDTCRNHPKIGPKPGFCAYSKRQKSQIRPTDS